MKKYLLPALVIIAVAAFVWYHQRPRHKPPQLLTVKRGTISTEAAAVGNILPQHSITIKSTLASAGTVAKLYHDAGDFVKAGTPLLQLKPNPDPKQYATALQNLNNYHADISLYNAKVKHYRELLAKQLIPPGFEEYLQAQHDLKQAQDNYRYQQQQIQLLQQGSAQIGTEKIASIIYSPISGFILERFVDKGDPVTPMSGYDSGSELFTIANMHDLIFKGEVNELDAGKVQIHMPASITVGAFPQQKISGKISKLALESSQQKAAQSTTAAQSQQTNQSPFNVGYPLEINQLKIPAQIKLRSGLSATAEIKIQTKQNVILIPESALLFKQQQAYVVGLDKNGHRQQIKVTLGISDGVQVEVKTGLSAGRAILANPMPNSEPTQ